MPSRDPNADAGTLSASIAATDAAIANGPSLLWGALNRAELELDDGVSWEEVVHAALQAIDLGYLTGGRVDLPARWVDWMIQQWAYADRELARLAALRTDPDARVAEMRGLAKGACLDLSEAYREAGEDHLKHRRADKAAEAFAWARGAIECAYAIRSLSLPEGGRS